MFAPVVEGLGQHYFWKYKICFIFIKNDSCLRDYTILPEVTSWSISWSLRVYLPVLVTFLTWITAPGIPTPVAELRILIKGSFFENFLKRIWVTVSSNYLINQTVLNYDLTLSINLIIIWLNKSIWLNRYNFTENTRNMTLF